MKTFFFRITQQLANVDFNFQGSSLELYSHNNNVCIKQFVLLAGKWAYDIITSVQDSTLSRSDKTVPVESSFNGFY